MVASKSGEPSQKACHNCRRARLRCDRSIPGCNKCSRAGQACLGYSKLFRWTDSVASRGRMTGKRTFALPSREKKAEEDSRSTWIIPQSASRTREVTNFVSNTLGFPLIDPLFQDLDFSSRKYLNYYISRFCQDLVVHGSPQRGSNPFSELLPMCGLYSCLRHILVGASAMHYSQLIYRSSLAGRANPGQLQAVVIDGLHARHKAIKALQAMLERYRIDSGVERKSSDKDALFATIVFFINFALIDSGRGGWRAHMEAAGKLVLDQTSNHNQANVVPSIDLKSLIRMSGTMTRQEDNHQNNALVLDSFMDSPHSCVVLADSVSTSHPREVGARDYIASDFASYYVWSSTLDSLASSASASSQTRGMSSELSPEDVLPILLRTEANSYHSCPARLLYLILRTSRLAREITSNGTGEPTLAQINACLDLMKEGRAFDVNAWAEEVFSVNARAYGVADHLELNLRKHVAATYRATACLMILLIAPGLQSFVRQQMLFNHEGEGLPALLNPDDYVSTILNELSFIPHDSPLFKYTTWPVFMTGVETACLERRKWVMDRLSKMWDVAPWGMLRSAMETLTYIWQLRDNAATVDGSTSSWFPETGETSQVDGTGAANWLVQLRGVGFDCLIV